jgi:hypothetical protein
MRSLRKQIIVGFHQLDHLLGNKWIEEFAVFWLPLEHTFVKWCAMRIIY